MPSINRKWILSLLLIISILFQSNFINSTLFHHDSVRLAQDVESTINSLSLHPTTNGRIGFVFINSILYYIPSKIFHFTNSGMIFNAITIIVSSLSIIFLYLFVHELVNNELIALYSSLLLLFNPLYLSISTYVNSSPFAILFILISLYYYMKALKDNDMIYWLLSSTFFCISLTIRIDSLLVLGFIVIMYLFRENKNIIASPIIIVPFMILICLSIIYPVFYFDSVDSMVLFPISDTINLFVYSIISFIKAFTIPMIVILIISIISSYIFKDKIRPILLLGFLLIFLPISISRVTSARLFIAGLIPLIIICAIYIQSIRSTRFQITILSILILYMVIISYPVLIYRHNYSGITDMADYVKYNTQNNSIIISNDYSVFFEYYGNRSTILNRLHDDNINRSSEFRYSLSEYLINNIPIYVFERDIINDYWYFNSSYWRLDVVSNHIIDEYHHSELDLQLRNLSLFRLSVR